MIKRGDIFFWARIRPTLGVYDVLEMKVRTVEDNWFVAIEKREKHAQLFNYSDINTVLFSDRKMALAKVKEAEKHKLKISNETDYEEY